MSEGLVLNYNCEVPIHLNHIYQLILVRILSRIRKDRVDF